MRDDATAAGWLERSYRRAKGGRVAFVDEAYRGFERKGETPFYIATAVVVETQYMEATREDLVGIAGGTYWHTTEAMRSPDGPARIVEMLRYLADGEEVCMMSVQREIARSDHDLETARRERLSGLARALHVGTPIAGNTMVIEKRNTDRARKQDSQLLPELVKHGHVDQRFRVHQASPSEDRLLWLPDLVAHAARRDLALRRPELYGEIKERVIEVAPVVSTEKASSPDLAALQPRSVAELLNDAMPRRGQAVQRPVQDRKRNGIGLPDNQLDLDHNRDLGTTP